MINISEKIYINFHIWIWLYDSNDAVDKNEITNILLKMAYVGKGAGGVKGKVASPVVCRAMELDRLSQTRSHFD